VEHFQEQTLNSFETMLGSGEQAKAFLNDLVQFAAKTPFELPGLAESSKLLLAFGFEAEEVIPIMTRVGDAVAGLGGGPEVMDGIIRALGQMQAKGKATAEEMMQLAERGIPAWQYLADAMGVSVSEAMDKVSKGAVTADQAISAILSGMEQDFSGLMEKQSTTWSGMLSTLSDTFNQFAGTVMAPIFERLKAGLAAVLEFVSKPEFMEFGKRLGETVASGMDRAASFATNTLLPALRGVYEAGRLLVTGDFRGGIFGLEEDHPAIGALLKLREVAISLGSEALAQVKAFFSALRGEEGGESFGAKLGEGFRNTIDIVQNQVLPALRSFGDWFVNDGLPKVQQFANTVRPVIEPVFGFLKDNLPTIVPLLATFAGAFAGLQGATSVLGGLLGPLTQVFSILRGAFSIAPMISTVVGLLGGPVTAAIIGIAAVVAVAFMAWQNNWFGIRDIVAQVWATVGPILQQIIGAIMQFAGEILASWRRWASEIAPLAQQAWENVKSAIQAVLNALLPIITAVLSGIVGFLRSHGEEIKGIVSGAWQVIRSVIEMVTGVIQGIIKTVLAVIAGDWGAAWDGIKQVASSIWEGIKGIISGALEIVKNYISIVLDAISGIWGRVWDGIKTVANTIWEGIKSVVSGAIDTVKTTISTTLDTINSTWQRIWDGAKTFLSTAWDTMKRTVIERITDILTEVGNIESKVTGVFSNAVNWLYNAGRDIIQGLINGVTSMVQNIVNAVVNTIQSGIEAAKRTLGISSPSRVFMEFGEASARGLIEGVRSFLDDVEDIGSTLARSLVPEAPTPAVATAGPTLTVTVHIDAVYANDPRSAEQAGQDVAYAIAQALRRRGVL
jgi:tape measure domain-containing protein